MRVRAERKHGTHLFQIYIYTILFEHDKYQWQVARTYKEIREVHKTLARIVKTDIGRSCSDMTLDDVKSDWPLFPMQQDNMVTSLDIENRCRHLAEYLQRLLTYPPFRDHPSVLNLVSVSPLSVKITI